MEIVLINGSPKVKGSTSGTLLAMLKKYLAQEPERKLTEFSFYKTQAEQQQITKLLESDVLIFAFPLYVDSIPSHLLRCLIQIEEYIHLQEAECDGNVCTQAHAPDSPSEKISVYVIVNNGFFQGKQNIPAIEVMQHWAKRCGFCFRQALGIGGGGMINFIQSVPDGHGPKKNISLALEEMAENIVQRKSGVTHVLEPNYPAWAYQWQAETGWRMMAKKNGLKKKDLDKQY